MAIIEKAEVLKRIRRSERIKGGKTYTSFEIYFGTDGHGKKLRETRPTENEARQRVDEFFRTVKKVGDAATLLKPSEIHDASEAKLLLEAAGIRSTLTDAVRRFIEGEKSVKVELVRRTLSQAYDEYYAEIPDLQALHKKAVRFRVRPWVVHAGPERFPDEITSRDVAEYLKTMRRSMKTYNNHLSYIKTFLTWCTKSERRYLAVNPLADMQKEKLAYSEPKFMRVEHFEKLIRAVAARPDAKRLIPYLALSYFCGVRREEIAYLRENPRDLLLDDESVRISKPKGWTQGRPPRIFKMQPNALAWIMEYYDGSATLCKSNKACMEDFREEAKKLGFVLGRNTGRHTFITMHVAAFGNPVLTDSITGTSSRMRSSHYQGLELKKNADRFFSIMPTVKDACASPAK